MILVFCFFVIIWILNYAINDVIKGSYYKGISIISLLAIATVLVSKVVFFF